MELRRIAAIVALVATPFASLAADTGAAQPPPEVAIATAPVVVDGQTVFAVRGISSFPAEERAAAIADRIRELARNPAIGTGEIVVVPGALGPEIRAGATLIMRMVAADGELEAVPVETLAVGHAARIREVVSRYRADRSVASLIDGTLLAGAATGLFVLLAFALRILYRRIEAVMEARYRRRIDALPVGSLQIAHGHQTWEVLTSALRATRLLVIVVLAYFWLQFVLRQFPWTRRLSAGLLDLLADPLLQIGQGFIDYLPDFLFLVVLALITRYGLRILRLYFEAVGRGTLKLNNFEAEWALPTYKILRTLVIALALVMAYPYIPGSGSEALRGISVFAGLLVSLGASSSVANVIAGYINTYGRVLKAGDMIRVGDTIGEVTQIRLHSTRLRTYTNEEVTIPNATLLASHVVNYSALSRTGGLILHTKVGIGYEVPWRQVHAILLEAAARTSGLAKEPAPFVLQRELGDFAVVYQLNVAKDSPQGMLRTYSELHQNVLDVFNEHGVQIMTPAYEGDPEKPKVVAKEDWFAPPAKSPP